MKKIFSILLVFTTFFIVSCGGLVEEDNSKNNTVRFTLPSGNARTVTASGVADISYYNVAIANQNFTNVTPGTTVESAPMPIGTNITVTVEAIGKIKDESGKTIVSGKRIAYYQTAQSLPAGGLTLNINLSEYKTSYHKVTTVFNNTPTSLYVEDGKRYIPPIYQNIISHSTPYLHTGWTYTGSGASGNGQFLALIQSVTITSDTEFTAECLTGYKLNFSVSDQQYSLIDLNFDKSIADMTISYYNDTYYYFPGIPFTLPTAKKRRGNTDDGPAEEIPVTQWKWEDGTSKEGTPNQVVTINSYKTSGSAFEIYTQ